MVCFSSRQQLSPKKFRPRLFEVTVLLSLEEDLSGSLISKINIVFSVFSKKKSTFFPLLDFLLEVH